MTTEKEWIEKCLQPRLQSALKEWKSEEEWSVCVESGRMLTYAHEILRYNANESDQRHNIKYQTDLLIHDINKNETWIPRIVLECKKGAVTTHDALTYSAKAATHKQVHPYLRYGILIGAFGSAIPGRLIRHGAYFDFMMVWSCEEPADNEWSELVNVLRTEVEASRRLQEILTESRSRSRKKYGLFHRKLELR